MFWCEIGRIFHRLTGPAEIFPDNQEYFWLNGDLYEDVNDWLKYHPNQDENFKKEMLELWG
jgi:hypothetical protein